MKGLCEAQMKRFSVQQFFKNAAEVWTSSPRLRSKSNCTMKENKNLRKKENKNLRENRKNRNCLQNQKVIIRVKVSGAIAIPKASWGCAPALPNLTQRVFPQKTILTPFQHKKPLIFRKNRLKTTCFV